jgi:peptidoglycan/LPS O-acetylase OafA/YrhL
MVGAVVAFAALHLSERLYALPASKEVIVGLSLGISTLENLETRWISEVGSRSYGVFLSHFAFIFLFQNYTSDVRHSVGMTTVIIALSTMSTSS